MKRTMSLKTILMATATLAILSLPVRAETVELSTGTAVDVPAAPGGKASAPGMEEGHKMMRRLEDMDANSDGNISKDEFMAAHEKKFTELDANGDGQIDKAEIQARRESWQEKMKEHRATRRGMKGDMKDEMNHAAPEGESAPQD